MPRGGGAPDARDRERRRPVGGVGGRRGPDVHWVGAGLRWQHDAVGCPSCEGRIEFGEGSLGRAATAGSPGRRWRSTWWAGRRWWPDWGRRADGGVGGRPAPRAPARPARAVQPGATRCWPRWRRRRAGSTPLLALDAMASVQEVAGRFTVRSFGAARARPMLAKNPAGWDELLDLVAGSPAPLVVSINARVADGADPSWLWDVPFERLAGRTVVATGDRYRDLSVRLQLRRGGAHDRALAGGARSAAAVRATGRARRRHRQLHGLPRPARARPREPGCAAGRACCSPTSSARTATAATGCPCPAREWRGRRHRAVAGGLGRAGARADIYCLGGGEDGPQVRGAHADRRRHAGAAGRGGCRGAGRVRWLPGGGAFVPRCGRRGTRGRRAPRRRDGEGRGAEGRGRGGGRARGAGGSGGTLGVPGAHRVREPRRGHRARRGHGAARPSHRGVGNGDGSEARGRAVSSGRISTGRYLREPPVGRCPVVVGARRHRARPPRRHGRGEPARGAVRRARRRRRLHRLRR